MWPPGGNACHVRGHWEKPPAQGFALLRAAGLAVPLLLPPGRSGKALFGSRPGEQGTHLSQRRLRFTFSALAIALAPATSMEFPRKLQRKAGGEEGQPGMALCCPRARGGGGRGGRSQETGKPGLVGHDARVEAVLS